jgi:hypothetical protein
MRGCFFEQSNPDIPKEMKRETTDAQPNAQR